MPSSFPSRGLDKFIIRLPDGMRPRIAEAAKRNHRSMNNEIVHHLAQAFGDGEAPTMGRSLQASPVAGPTDTACQGGPETHG